MTAAIPRPAATLCLLNDGEAGLEVLMVRRSQVASFVGGFFVFPGGTLDEADHGDLAAGLLPGVNDDLRPFIGAAIRETAEETGVLLSETPIPDVADRAKSLTSEQFYREVAAAGTSLRSVDLAYFANWITPESEPKRFDAKFFLAATEQRHDASADGTEVTEAVWVTPATALRNAADGRWGVIFPTWKTLELLAEFATTTEALAHARSIDVEARQPRVVRADDGSIKIVLPGEPEWSLGGRLPG